MKPKLLILALILQLVILSCKKSDDKIIDCQIIGFEFAKCFCCWGWIIKNGNDTIKTDSLPSNFKMDEKFPIKVKIELGEKTQNCSAYRKHDYYKLKSIERVE